jgi:hypothetical protein
MEEALAPGPNFNRPVKDLEYKDLLTSTFTQASHDRGIKTWRASASYPQCVFCGNKYRYEAFNVACHMDPYIGKATIGKERTVAACKESLPLARGPHRNRFLEVQAEIRAWRDKKTLLAEANASATRNLISVGGYADTPAHVDAAGNAEGKRPCLGNGQTVLMRTPTQAEFVECWSEAIIRNDLPPALVDDPLFRKALVTTSRMGQTAVCMGKGTALGKMDTTLPHCHTFIRKIIPATDKRLDEEGMAILAILSSQKTECAPKGAKTEGKIDDEVEKIREELWQEREKNLKLEAQLKVLTRDKQMYDAHVKDGTQQLSSSTYETNAGKETDEPQKDPSLLEEKKKQPRKRQGEEPFMTTNKKEKKEKIEPDQKKKKVECKLYGVRKNMKMGVLTAGAYMYIRYEDTCEVV